MEAVEALELGLDGVAYVLATVGDGLSAFDDPAAEGALRTATLLAPNLSQPRLLRPRWPPSAYRGRLMTRL